MGERRSVLRLESDPQAPLRKPDVAHLAIRGPAFPAETTHAMTVLAAGRRNLVHRAQSPVHRLYGSNDARTPLVVAPAGYHGRPPDSKVGQKTRLSRFSDMSVGRRRRVSYAGVFR